MKLWNNIAALQVAAVVSTLILTIGAVIEYRASLQLLAMLSLKWLLRKSTPFERCAFRKLLLHTIGPILVVLGIAGEVVFEGRDFVLEDERGEQSQQTIATLQTQTSTNDKDAAQLRKDAERLKKDAESEHLARAKIEARVAWRRLTDEQKTDVGKALGDFSKHEGASLWYTYGDTESQIFANDIAEALTISRIVVQPPSTFMSLPGMGHFGDPIKPVPVGVEVLPTKDEASIKLAVRLLKELNDRGFDAVRRTDPVFKDASIPQIEVYVHPRPLGPQGEYKLQAQRGSK